jgi:aspartyl/asparaginyl beta-hydroxylase (cupin superfamily)
MLYLILLLIIIMVILVTLIYFYYAHPYWLVEKWNQYLPQQTFPIFLPPEETTAKSFHEDLILNWNELQKEILEHYQEGIPMKDLDDIQSDLMQKEDGWTTLWLKMYNENFSNYLPTLSKILESHPEVITCNISILKPNVIIPYHYGPFRGVYRYHLGIQVPIGNLGIKLIPSTISNGMKYEKESDAEIYRWKEKEGIVFDDTLLHTAWNKTNQTRIVIFADVLKPVTLWKKIVNSLVIGLVQRTKHVSKIKKNILAGYNISFN